MVTGPENHRKGSHTVAFFWGRWNIPASTTQLTEGQPRGAEQPDGSRQLASDDGIVGYDPPCAPLGAGPIHYQFKLYALDQMLSLPSNATRERISRRWMATSSAPAVLRSAGALAAKSCLELRFYASSILDP